MEKIWKSQTAAAHARSGNCVCERGRDLTFLNILKYFTPKAAASGTMLIWIHYVLCRHIVIMYRSFHKMYLAYEVLNTIEFWSWNCNKGDALWQLNTWMGQVFCSCSSNSIANASHHGAIKIKNKTHKTKNPKHLTTHNEAIKELRLCWHTYSNLWQ